MMNRVSTGATWVGVAPLPAPAMAVAFAGKKGKKRAFHPEAERLEQRLLAAGVNRDSLRTQWGVALWRLQSKDGLVKVRVAPLQGEVDVKGLRQHLREALQQPVDVDVRSLKKCCGGGCKGCLSGNRDKRKSWIG